MTALQYTVANRIFDEDRTEQGYVFHVIVTSLGAIVGPVIGGAYRGEGWRTRSSHVLFMSRSTVWSDGKLQIDHSYLGLFPLHQFHRIQCDNLIVEKEENQRSRTKSNAHSFRNQSQLRVFSLTWKHNHPSWVIRERHGWNNVGFGSLPMNWVTAKTCLEDEETQRASRRYIYSIV